MVKSDLQNFIYLIWARLFHSENCCAVAVFGQKMATWLQGWKKNCVQLRFDRKAERPQKELFPLCFSPSLGLCLGHSTPLDVFYRGEGECTAQARQDGERYLSPSLFLHNCCWTDFPPTHDTILSPSLPKSGIFDVKISLFEWPFWFGGFSVPPVKRQHFHSATNLGLGLSAQIGKLSISYY